MSVPPLVPLQNFIGIIESITAYNIEQKAILLDIAFSLKRLIVSTDRIEHFIYLGDLFKMEEYVYRVFKGHTKLGHIKQMYVEVYNYV